MILFNNVTKEYKNHKVTRALDNVSFEIKEGEFVFIVGPSGSGKSTIVRMLIREEVPTFGKIFFNDIEITKLKRKGLPILRREIGVVFQDYKLLPHKTVGENVDFILEVAGKKRQEISQITTSILDLVGLTDQINNFPNQLSGGEMQRVAIARALANDPQVLIADEPTGNLDPENAWDVTQLLNKINGWGTTVIMATHEKVVVDSMKRRVIELENGRIVRDEGKGNYSQKEKHKKEKKEMIEEGEDTKKRKEKKKHKKTKK